MATLTAVKSGDFHDPTVWDLGRVPGVGDTAKPASYIITITQNVTCDRLDGTAQNGYFQCSTPGITITANAQAGNVILLRFSHTSGECTVNGTVTGGSGSGAYGVQNNSTGTVNVTTAIGGSGQYAYGACNYSSGTVNVTTAIGGSGQYAYGAYNYSSGTVNVTTAIGGSGGSAYGAYNGSSGTLRCKRAIGNNYGPGGSHSNNNPGVVGNNTVGQVTTVEEIEFGPYGAQPVTGAVLLLDKSTNEAQFRLALAGATKTLLDATASCDYPAESDVRSGVEYDNGDMTGTCAVPAPEYVAYGVAVDDTVGTALLTPDAAAQAVWEYAGGSGRTLTSFGSLVSDIATAVWEYATRTITSGGITAKEIWEYTSRTLTQTAAEVMAAISGSDLVIYRGDSWSAALTGLGDISARSKLYFTLKSNNRQTDAEAMVQIEETDGLIVLNGTAMTGTDVLNGSLVVNDEVNGNVTLALAATVTAQLECAEGLLYDIQVVNADGAVHTLTAGTAVVLADVTRAVS